MTIKNYTIGFVSCLLLTFASFSVVDMHLRTHHAYPAHTVLFAGLMLFALAQLLAQMVFFLHIGRQSKQRDLVALAFSITITIFVVGGSLWIMANLTHDNTMPFEGTVAPQHEL